jgi:5-methylcytosine-specific restriction protein A
MPTKPKSPCRYQGCPELSHTRFCEKHTAFENKVYEKYRRDKDTWKRYGNRWRKIREIFIRENPLCKVCKSKGKLVSANEVHHKIPIIKGGSHNKGNLMSLCKICHSEITARESGFR